MIFSEVYSAYYRTVAAILTAATSGTLNGASIRALVEENAFSESVLTIPEALQSGKWPLLRPDMTTPLTHAPTAPPTGLELRWLKAILADPRVRLFDSPTDGGGSLLSALDEALKEVVPLFAPEDILYYDRYTDGDPFGDPAYIARFRMILSAIHEQSPLDLTVINRQGRLSRLTVLPRRLEYSAKDDKFRLLSTGSRYGGTVNLARITDCRPGIHAQRDGRRGFGPDRTVTYHAADCEAVLKITDHRNALERVMLHFAHFEKRAEQIGKDTYLLRIRYNMSDETELVIRVLSFGPFVEAVAPDSFVELIRDRLIAQMALGTR